MLNAALNDRINIDIIHILIIYFPDFHNSLTLPDYIQTSKFLIESCYTLRTSAVPQKYDDRSHFLSQ
nr:unnamed protein product [Callosobruchus chinensis]